MVEVLGWLVGIGLASFSLVVAALALTLWRLRRRNRLHPSLPTAAPLAWLCSPRRAARLHRRLRLALANAGYRGQRRRPARRDDVLDDLTRDLVHEAVAVDRRLVAVGLAPRPLRRGQLNLLDDDVARLERLAARLADLAHFGAATDDSAGLDALEERIGHLEGAQREVDRLEALYALPGDPLSPRRLDRPPAA